MKPSLLIALGVAALIAGLSQAIALPIIFSGADSAYSAGYAVGRAVATLILLGAGLQLVYRGREKRLALGQRKPSA